ncbi:MAG: ribosome-associated translation inhibitor RaiA [Thiotrichales bacterium]|nr:ribosome-associated translation inhibitor RaiA [Thiotrichales bacterium]
MQIQLTGHHVELTPNLRRYVDRKVGRVARHFDQVTSARVILTAERQSSKAEATLHVSGAELFANATHHDMFAAIDLLADRIDGQVRRHKEKLTDHHRAEGSIKTRFD